MKILHIMNCYCEGYNYQEHNLPYYQRQQGNEVIILTSYKPYAFMNQKNKQITTSDKGVEIIRKKVLFYKSKKPYFLLYFYNLLLKEIKKINPDVIHIHGEKNIAINNAVKYKKQDNKNVKIFVDVHGEAANTKITGTLFQIRKKLLQNMYKKNMKYINGFLPVAEGCEEYLKILLENYVPNEKINILRLGSEKNEMKNYEIIRKNLRKNLNIMDKEIIFMNSGKLHKQIKNVDLILNAFNEIKKTKEDIKLLLVGSFDDDIKKIYDRNKEKIIHIDTVSSTELKNYYYASDIAVWSSPSISIQEAMSCKLPLLIKNIPGIKWLASHNNGFLFNNEEELIKKMKLLLDNKDKLKKYSENSKEIADLKLDWENIASESIELYRRM